MEKQTEKNGFSYYFRIAGSLVVICAVMALLLALVNNFTKDVIAENDRKTVDTTIKKIFSDYGENIVIEECDYTPSGTSSVSDIYEIKFAGERIGYVAVAEPTGFKDVIKMAVGVNPDGTCRSVEVIAISDTPGLGTKVKESDFLSRYVGAANEQKLTADGGSIDAATGATISSRAATLGVSDCLVAVADIINGGDAE